MGYEKKTFDHLLGMQGFSDTLLQNHFKLYAGYVANTNKGAALMKTLTPGSPEYAEVRRRFGWEFNGMRLHELYFDNLAKGGKSFDPASELSQLMMKEFGHFDDWKKDFLSVASFRGIGWVILAYDPVGKSLFNVWINEHDAGHLAGAVPLLVLDVFEHAFVTDYGLNKAEYIASFFSAIDWSAVGNRL
jgi:superoxide dismutase, Fe-Mn family